MSLPQIPLVAADGVNQQTAAKFILSRATAIEIGTELIPTEAIQRRQSKHILELCPRTNRGLAEEHCRQEIHSGGKVRAAIGTLTATRTAELRSIFTQQGDRSSNELCLP
jgi:hypothetical protein